MLSRVTQSCPLIRVQTWERRGVKVPDAVKCLLQLDWPTQAGAVATGRVDVICIGPSDWLVVAGSEVSVDELLEALKQAFSGSSFRAVDLSSALARIWLAGDDARALLSKVCALDLGSTGLQPGRAPRTLVAGLPTIVHCLEHSCFECITPSSYADYLLSWLNDAAVEFQSAGGDPTGLSRMVG